MMMKRAIIIAKGRVQKVRYRSKVKEIADELGIVGDVENLEDGSVRIFAEGEEEVLDGFIGKLRIKNRLIDVKDISVSFEDATGEFSAFKKLISGTMYEVAERLDEAANILERLTGVVISGNEKITDTIESGNEKIIGTIESGNEKIIGTIESGNEKIIGTIESGNEKIIGTIESGNEKIIGTIESGNEKIIGTIEHGTEILGEKLDGIKGDTSAMLEKEDTTIEILKDVREDTEEIANAQVFLKEIHRETLELREKYEVLSKDVEAIKVRLEVDE